MDIRSIKRHSSNIRYIEAKKVELLRYLSFIAHIVTNGFAQVEYLFLKYDIENAFQLFNFEETGYSPGMENEGPNWNSDITKGKYNIDLPNIQSNT